jgi:hypothetical protein
MSPDVHDGRTNLFLRYPSQANKGGHIYTSSQVYEDLIKNFAMADAKPVSTPMSRMTTLDPNEDGKVDDQRE